MTFDPLDLPSPDSNGEPPPVPLPGEPDAATLLILVRDALSAGNVRAWAATNNWWKYTTAAADLAARTHAALEFACTPGLSDDARAEMYRTAAGMLAELVPAPAEVTR